MAADTYSHLSLYLETWSKYLTQWRFGIGNHLRIPNSQKRPHQMPEIPPYIPVPTLTSGPPSHYRSLILTHHKGFFTDNVNISLPSNSETLSSMPYPPPTFDQTVRKFEDWTCFWGL